MELRKMCVKSRKPGYQLSKPTRCTAPGMPCSSRYAAMSMPSTLSQRAISGWMLLEVGQWRDFVRRAQIAAVPGDDLVLPVGIEGGPEHEDHVVENGVNLGVALRGDKLVGERDRLLRAGDLGRVQAAIDMHDGLAF